MRGPCHTASALTAKSSARPAAASPAQKTNTQLVTVIATSYGATQADLTALPAGRWAVAPGLRAVGGVDRP
jgi:hypothetical protein